MQDNFICCPPSSNDANQVEPQKNIKFNEASPNKDELNVKENQSSSKKSNKKSRNDNNSVKSINNDTSVLGKSDRGHLPLKQLDTIETSDLQQKTTILAGANNITENEFSPNDKFEKIKSNLYTVDQMADNLRTVYEIFHQQGVKPQQQQAAIGDDDQEEANIAEQSNEQKAVIVALAKTMFDDQNESHHYILDCLRNKLAMCLPHHALLSLKVHLDLPMFFSEANFEKDITEAVGFTNGYQPQKDIVEAKEEMNTGMLGLICVLKFIERLDKLYIDSFQDFEGEVNQNLCLMNLLFMAQNTPGKSRLDGFPIILVMLEIVQSCIHLVEEKPYVAKNPYQKRELQYWKHHQKVFMLISQKFFNNNIYQTFNEYIYHLILSFCLAWHVSLGHVDKSLQQNLQNNIEREQQAQQEQEKGPSFKSDQRIVFLYKILFDRKMKEPKGNHHSIESYRDLIDDVEDFVFTNIQELVYLHQCQTDFKIIAAKMIKK